MENLQNYLDQIVFWVCTAVAALGGTSLSIGAIILWIKRIISACVERLSKQTTDYSQKAEELDKVTSQILCVEGALRQMSERLDGFQKDYNDLKERFKASEERNDQLLQVIYIMASNTPTLVSNGAAGEIAKVLGLNKEDIEIGELNSETDG